MDVRAMTTFAYDINEIIDPCSVRYDRAVCIGIHAYRAERHILRASVSGYELLHRTHSAAWKDVYNDRKHLSIHGRKNPLRSDISYGLQYAARVTALSVPMMGRAAALRSVMGLLYDTDCHFRHYAGTFSIYRMLFDAACMTRNASLVMAMFRTLVWRTPPRSPRVLRMLRARWSVWLDEAHVLPVPLEEWWWHSRDMHIFLSPLSLLRVPTVHYLPAARGGHECTVCYRQQQGCGSDESSVSMQKCSLCSCFLCRDCMKVWFARSPTCPTCRMHVA